MELPEFFQLAEGYAIYRPVARVTFDQVIEMAVMAVKFCRDQGIRRVLLDSRQLTGFGPPTTIQRFLLGERMAAAAQSKVIGVVVARQEMIDPNRFGVTVARNRGWLNNVFSDEAEAVKWLMDEDK